MNSTIHRRIEAIQRGETPKGYKKSQWGTIPSNWDIRPFNSLFSRITRRNDINNSNVLTISAQYGLVNQESFFNKSIASENKTNYFLLRKGDFAYNKSYSTGYPFGAIKPLIAYETGIVSPLYICFTPTAQNSCPEFYDHYFEGGMHNREIKAIAEEGARNHGLLNMSISDFFNSLLLVPPLREQEAIAEILTHQDRLIVLLQKLIDEKRRQKKYLMQTLLTGKTRLPGFKDKWKTKTLGEIATFCSGGTPNRDRSDYFGGTIPWIKSGELNRDIITETEESITDLGLSNSSAKIIPAGTILIAMYGATAGVVAITNISAAINQAILAVKPTIPISICFLYNSIKNIMITAVNKYTQGGQPNFNSAIIKKLSISLPPLPEQEAIAEVLSTADEELSLLERELEQEKLRKKALMQLLLTGLVRVEEL